VTFDREQILREADSYLDLEPNPITRTSSERSAGGIHDFYSEGDYWWQNPEDPDGPYIRKDGQTNPDNFTDHRVAMRNLSRWVAALTAAYALTGEEMYAERAILHLRTWFLDDATRMNPSLLYAQAIKGKVTGRGIGIIDTIHLIEVVRSIEVLEAKGILSGTDLEGLKDWFEQYVTWMTTHQYGIDEGNKDNNHGTWWAAQVAAFASLVRRDDLLAQSRKRFKELLSHQMDETGGFHEELRRTKPYNYSLFNLEGYAVLAWYASTPEDDLWNYETEHGSLRRAIDYMLPFIADKGAWPHKTDVQHFDEIPIKSAFLLLAGRAYKDEDYLALWQVLPVERLSKEVDRNFPIRQLSLWEQEKTNVVMIIVDDLNDWVGAMGGHPDTKTPNMDRLASQGTLFMNAHATAALCGPSRASVMTGLRPSTSGIYGQLSDQDIKKASPATENITFMTEYFADHGYKTMGIGKIFHNAAPDGSLEEYGGRIKGFGPHPENEFVWDSDRTNTDWGVFPERDEDMIDYKSAMWAKDKLAEEHDRPFFLAVGFIRPHAPWYAPQKWFDMHPPAQLTMPPYLKGDQDDIPAISRAIHEMPMMPTTEWAIETGEWPNIVQGYLASISFVDHYIGEVLKALEDSPYADNTIVVLWGDHGYHIGEKNRFAKHSLWEETSRVPLIISSPDGVRGQVTYTPASLLDLYPTLLDLADLPANATNEGGSLKALVEGNAEASGRVAITSYGHGNHAIRDERYRYIRFTDGTEELYDHESDPDEWKNLAGDSEYDEIKARLAQHLPKVQAPFSSVHSGRPTNDYFEELYEKSGARARK
jgi:arylsulfatase A-like enzyme